jgi:hypothetical protein
MIDDMWDDWAADATARRQAQDAREHRTMANLLLARRQEQAVPLVGPRARSPSNALSLPVQ